MSKRAEPLPDGSPDMRWLPFSPAGRWPVVLAGLVLVLAVLAAYHNSFSVPFLLDDRVAIVDNQTIRHLWPIKPVLAPPRNGATVNGRPLVNLSLAANYALGGTGTWGYHTLNLAIHIFSSLTLLGIVRRTLLLKPASPSAREIEVKTRTGSAHPAISRVERFGIAALPLALAVALLWAVHPLQTESVTYVVQRAESLMGLFYLLTLYAFIRGTQSGTVGWYVLALVACLLGMATKEVMVSAPVIVWLYDRTFVAGTFRGALRQRWRVYVGLGGSWLLLAWLVANAGEFVSGRAGFHAAVGWRPYALTQFWAVAHYLWLSVWPQPLVFDYGTFLVTRAAQVVPSALVVLLLVAGTAVSLWRWPPIGFLGCWFFAILAPTSSLMPLVGQTVAEHRMYVSLAAVVAIVVFAIYAWLGRRSLGIFLAFALVSGLLTLRRNEDYRSEVAIWTDTVTKQADNAWAHFNLGIALVRNGRTPEAIEQFECALRINPVYAEAHSALGGALYQLGRIPEAVEQYEQALRITPEFADAHFNLGIALPRLGRGAEAIGHLQQAVLLKPADAEAHSNLGVALFQAGRVSEAIGHLEQALLITPDDPGIRNNLGTALIRFGDELTSEGKCDEAIGRYRRVLQLKPGNAQAHDSLGLALSRCGRFGEAMVQFGQVLELDPGSVAARNHLAWLLATCGDASVRDGARAVELAERANQLAGGKDARILDTLAAAYAQTGRFDDAVRMAEAALALARSAGSVETARRIQLRLQLYQAGRPYHAGATEAP